MVYHDSQTALNELVVSMIETISDITSIPHSYTLSLLSHCMSLHTRSTQVYTVALTYVVC